MPQSNSDLNRKFTHGSLFSGIGCWSYASDMMGWDTVFHSEINPFCQTLLKYYWPDADLFGDITKTDFTPYANRIDVLSVSCPCQPFSTAGNQEGTADVRHLWPAAIGTIKQVKPVWVCYENVPGILSTELGLVFEQVQSDLENEGYEVWPVVLPACSTGAPHKRYRIWIIAYSCTFQRNRERSEGFNGKQRRQALSNIERNAEQGVAPFAERQLSTLYEWEKFPTQSPVFIGNDGFAGELVGITVSKWREESEGAIGNAIYWPIAYNIFQAIAAAV